jgi:hypothetical protein
MLNYMTEKLVHDMKIPKLVDTLQQAGEKWLSGGYFNTAMELST